MTLDVSVIVVNHNGADYLESCLEAIYRAEPDEVLLVDSGSTDGAQHAAASKWPLRLLELEGNLGPSAARNLGMREAKNGFVVLIDNDVEVRGDCLRQLVDALRADDKLALVQARSVLGDEEGVVHYDGGRFHFVGLIALRNWYVPQADATRRTGADLAESDVAVSLCCAGRRDVLLEAGGFDESMFILFEDLALSYAIKMRGYRIAVDGRTPCVHKGGTKGLSTRGTDGGYAARRSFLHSRNRWIFLLTHYRMRALVLFAPALLAYGFVHLLFVLTKGHFGAWIRGKVALWDMRRELRSRRAIVQRGRVLGDGALLAAPALTVNPGLAEGLLLGAIRKTLDSVLRLCFLCVRWAV